MLLPLMCIHHFQKLYVKFLFLILIIPSSLPYSPKNKFSQINGKRYWRAWQYLNLSRLRHSAFNPIPITGQLNCPTFTVINHTVMNIFVHSDLSKFQVISLETFPGAEFLDQRPLEASDTNTREPFSKSEQLNPRGVSESLSTEALLIKEPLLHLIILIDETLWKSLWEPLISRTSHRVTTLSRQDSRLTGVPWRLMAFTPPVLGLRPPSDPKGRWENLMTQVPEMLTWPSQLLRGNRAISAPTGFSRMCPPC